MVMRDSAQQATLYGQYGQMWEENSIGFATDSALMVDWSDDDHTAYIHADTLYTREEPYPDSDSTYRRVQAHYGVRVYRDDMQMTCDSLVYLSSDSTMHLYTQPICWSENQQIAADSMVVYIVNGAVDHAVGTGSALCVMQETLATIITSLRSNKALVALWRSLSISSLIEASFSIYVSDWGIYASG